VIDFDLLVFGDLRITTADLTVPHPGVAERAFVVMPLKDIAPDLDIPGIGNVAMLARRIDASGLQVL
jgi:2-amino-4-hydroxy-6-hydroxymethyldihydropteridine diphosphokinase